MRKIYALQNQSKEIPQRPPHLALIAQVPDQHNPLVPIQPDQCRRHDHALNDRPPGLREHVDDLQFRRQRTPFKPVKQDREIMHGAYRVGSRFRDIKA